MSESIVSNTGPLITLEKLPDGYAFIRKLYRKLLVPPEVAQEVSQPVGSVERYLQQYQVADLFEISRVNGIAAIPEIDRLDAGEIMAISLAVERQSELLIEEINGRRIASAAGIAVSGIAGQIGRACRNGLIDKQEAEDKLRILFVRGRINREVYRLVVEML